MNDTDLRVEREKQFHDEIYQDSRRAPLRKYYSITQASQDRYRAELLDGVAGKRVLEYGCGFGSQAFLLAEHGADVVGIDISGVAIDKARKQARELGHQERLSFEVMDAEQLGFDDASFDLVCGTGILHHLDLDRAVPELARVLKSTGRAAFVEPLGHNPLINLFRASTPRMRSDDEHPLVKADVRLAGDSFGGVQMDCFYLSSLAAVPMRRSPFFGRAVAALNTVDRGLFRIAPVTRWWAWQCLLVMTDPKTPLTNAAADAA